MPDITVKYTCACARCGFINITTTINIDKEHFEKMAQEDPGSYWEEKETKGSVYRHHEEGGRGNCRRSC